LNNNTQMRLWRIERFSSTEPKIAAIQSLPQVISWLESVAAEVKWWIDFAGQGGRALCVSGYCVQAQ
jgi:hypothetical protein